MRNWNHDCDIVVIHVTAMAIINGLKCITGIKISMKLNNDNIKYMASLQTV